MFGIGDQLVPVGAIDAHRELVRVEAGTRNHGQNLAIAGVHGHDGAVAIAQGQLRRALQIVVDGQAQVLAGNGVLDSQIANFASVAVHNHIPRSVLPAQQLVVGLLHARFAHYVARFIGRIAWVVEHVFAHFAHIADQVRRKPVAWIEPARLVNGLQLRQFVAMRLDKRLLVGGDVLLDGDGLIPR